MYRPMRFWQTTYCRDGIVTVGGGQGEIRTTLPIGIDKALAAIW